MLNTTWYVHTKKCKLILLAFSACAFAQTNLPRPPGARVIDLTGKGYFNEPAIAVNPANPQQLVAAWQVNTSVAYSQDGGATWTTAKDTASKTFKISGDVAVVYDAKGAAIVAYLGFDKLGTENYWAHNATRNGLFVRRSADGGKTWDAPCGERKSHRARHSFRRQTGDGGRYDAGPLSRQHLYRLDG